MFRKVLFVFAIAALLSACGPSEAALATAQAETEAARPTATATATPTPKPTATPTHTPVPTTAADVVAENFAGLRILFEENFDAAELPQGWTAHSSVEGVARRGSLDPSGDGELMITGPAKAVYNELLLGLNQGFFARIMSNPLADFHIGLESAPNGQIIQRYRSNSSAYMFDMETPRGVSSQIWREDDYGFIPWGSSLTEGEWYYIAMGVDSNKNLLIRVWNDTELIDFRHPIEAHAFPLEDLADAYRFVITVRNNGVFYLDDLQFFEFDGF